MLLGQNWIFTLDFNPRPRKEGDSADEILHSD